MPREIDSLAEKACRLFRELQNAALADCGCAGSEAAERQFRISWHTGMEDIELAEEFLQAAAEATASTQSVQNARVFCYACGGADCCHAQQEEPGQVFAGYHSTGRPRWQEFFNYLLSLNDERTDLLFNTKPEILARVIDRGTLIAGQLASFGRNSLSYRIWGQVVAGYFYLNQMRAALSVQIVEDHSHRLQLQVITPLELTDALANAEDERRSAFHRIHDAIAEARRQTLSLSGLWQQAPDAAGRGKLQKNIFTILRHLAGSLERKGRQQRRRTVHAETRGKQQRPVHKANEDLRRAKPEDFFRDTHRDAVIVLGKNGRVHVFNREARHITSLILGSDELESRQRRRRYVNLTTAEFNDFQASSDYGALKNQTAVSASDTTRQN